VHSVLTYHSQNIAGHDTADNDHVAFAQDLEALHAAGARIAPLSGLPDVLEADASPGREPVVYLTLDDGCDFDARDIEWPGLGLQRSMLGIMRDFERRHGRDAQPGLHATSFVIASPEAREVIDRKSLFGRGWMSEDWWAEADRLLSVANHGWDHNHPDLANGADGPREPAVFADEAECRRQVVDAAAYIEARTGAWPEFFAYPFGESSAFVRERFFPEQRELHRTLAAFGTQPGPVTPDSDRWHLPRYVCGHDWNSPEELLALVGTA
jgi:peptidoglycan/xylan/chitin deacetylase (PgdA/CDA1 family)